MAADKALTGTRGALHLEPFSGYYSPSYLTNGMQYSLPGKDGSPFCFPADMPLTGIGRLLGSTRLDISPGSNAGKVLVSEGSRTGFEHLDVQSVSSHNAYYAMVAAGSVAEQAASIGLAYLAFKYRRQAPLQSCFAGALALQFWSANTFYAASGSGDWTVLANAGVDPGAAAGVIAMSLPAFAGFLYFNERRAEARRAEGEALSRAIGKGAIHREALKEAWESYPRREKVLDLLDSALELSSKEGLSRLGEWRLAGLLKKIRREDGKYARFLCGRFREEVGPELESRRAAEAVKPKSSIGLALRRISRGKAEGREPIAAVLVDGAGNSFGVSQDLKVLAVCSPKGDSARFRRDGSVDYVFSGGYCLKAGRDGRVSSIRSPRGKQVAPKTAEWEREKARLRELFAPLRRLREEAAPSGMERLYGSAVLERLNGAAKEAGSLSERRDNPVDALPVRYLLEGAMRLWEAKDFFRAEKLLEVAAECASDPYVLEFLEFSKRMGELRGGPEMLAPPPRDGGAELIGGLKAYRRRERAKGLGAELYSPSLAIAEEAARQARVGDEGTASWLASVINAIESDPEYARRLDAFLASKRPGARNLSNI
jgi:hypothetical protein